MGALPAGPVRVALTLLLAAACTAPTLVAQDGTVVGRVSSEGTPLSRAEVSVMRPGGSVLRSVPTAADGSYRLTAPSGSVELVVSMLGYAQVSTRVAVPPGGTVQQDFELEIDPFRLQHISVTAGRAPEKSLTTAGSISVVDATDVSTHAAVTPIDHLEGLAGVDVAVQGIQARQITTRGFNGLFGQLLTTMTDYRHASTPSLRVNLAYTYVPVADDIEQIEVLRGPASALYGPAAADGVVHIITKSPFDSEGSSVELAGGGRSLFQGALRHASVVNDWLAFKVSGQYFRGNEWGVTPQPTELAQRDPVQERAAGQLRLDGDFGDTDAVLTLGRFHGLRYVEQTAIGASQVEDWTVSHGQLRVTNGRLFAQAYVNLSDAGKTRTLQTLLPIVDESRVLVGQVQHGVDLGDRISLTYGLDAQRTDTRTGGTISGRNEDDDTIDEIGAYLHAQVLLTERLRAIGAVRADDHNRLPDPVFSPQLALVFEPAEGHSVRATYNRAFTPPVPTDLTLDLVTGTFDPLPFTVRARGVPLDGYRFSQACGGLCMASPFAPGALPLDATALWPAVVAILQAQGIDLSALPAPTANDVGTRLRVLNPATLAFDAHSGVVRDIDPLEPTRTTSLELGYKGILDDRVLVSADLYFTRRRDFRSSLGVQTPNAFLDTADLSAYLARFMPAGQAAQLAAGIGGVDGEPLLTGIPLGTVAPDDPLAGSDILLTYRNFGDLDYWGTDLSIEVRLSRRVSWTAAYSFLSDNFFTASEIGEDLTLNAPRNKGFTSLRYRDTATGVWGSVRARFVGEFRQLQGVWRGTVESFYTLDAEVGAEVPGAEGLDLSIAGRNLTNNAHSEFVGAPVLGRLLLVKARYRL